MTMLPEKIEALPLGKYVLADNAYACTEHLLTPFAGNQKNDFVNSAYNFYLSQCRIQIEMAFGFLTNKWRIFKHPLQQRLDQVGPLFQCAVRLHNYCINEMLLRDKLTRTGMNDEAMIAAHVNAHAPERPQITFISSGVVMTIPGNSIMRDQLVTKIDQQNLRRPAHNLARNGARQRQEVLEEDDDEEDDET